MVLNSKKVAHFIHIDLICHCDAPHEIITDYDSHFLNEVARKFDEYKIVINHHLIDHKRME